MASDSVFLDKGRGAKASVTLRLKRGSLSREEVSSISRLVAGSVDELKPTDVVIVMRIRINRFDRETTQRRR